MCAVKLCSTILANSISSLWGGKTRKIVIHVLREHPAGWGGPRSQRMQTGALPALPTPSLGGWHLFHLPCRGMMLSGAHSAPRPRTQSSIPSRASQGDLTPSSIPTTSLHHAAPDPEAQGFSKLNPWGCFTHKTQRTRFSVTQKWGFSLDWGHLGSPRAKQGHLHSAGAGVPLQLSPSLSASPSKITIFDIRTVGTHPSPSAASIWHTNPQIGCVASLNYLQRIHQGIFSCLKRVFDAVTFIWCFTDPRRGCHCLP